VPLPGISAAKAAPTAFADEPTRVGEAAPASDAVDMDFSDVPTGAMPPVKSVPLPGSAPSGVRSAGSVPLPGSAPSGVRAPPAGRGVPLPGSSSSAVRAGATTAAVPLPGAGGFSSGDSLEVDFGSSDSTMGAVPLPGGSSAATQAVAAFQSGGDEVPFSDDFGDAQAPAPAAADPSAFEFPDLSGGGEESAAPSHVARSSFDFGDPPAPAAAAPGGFDFDAPPPPEPAAAPGGFSFDAPPDRKSVV
jgi:hypothetical protein